MKKIREIAEVREKLDRPPNVVDYLFLKKYGEIPAYVSGKTGVLDDSRSEILDGLYRLGMDEKSIGEVEELLLPENLLYAVEKSDFFGEKFKGIEVGKMKNSEDLKKLPPLTNHDFRNPDLYPYGLWIKGKAVYKTFQSGATTGDPCITAYSEVDTKVGALVFAHGYRDLMGIKKGDIVLIYGPGESHLYGSQAELCCGLIGATPIWRHFKKVGSTEALLKQIESIKPHVLVVAPHGPKGAAGALDVLLQEDLEKGMGIFNETLKGRKIMIGGTPISKELAAGLYQSGIGDIINAYGGGQAGGFYDSPESKLRKGKGKRDDNVNFFSDVQIPQGYWIISPLEDKGGAPKNWNEIAITTLGREIQPIIKYAPGDYAKIVEPSTRDRYKSKRLEDICRKEFFAQKEGKIQVVIPLGVKTCVSDV
jgi:phenylacetate-coenzyme A ligase PaaK-like adenylate-forming protein